MPPSPQPLIDPPELARRNNGNQAVHRACLCRRRLRRVLSKLRPQTRRSSEKIPAAPDWPAAEREARPVRTVGFFRPC